MISASARFLAVSAWAMACQTCVGAPACDTATDGCVADGSTSDAGPRDAARDASRPTADTAVDSADGETGDVSTPSGDPGWVHLADAPPDCSYDVATHPENVTPGPLAAGLRIPMINCGSGCRRTTTSVYSPSDVFRAGGRTLAILGYTEDLVGPIMPVVRTVVDLDAATTAAIRFQIDFSGTGIHCGTDHFGGSGSDIGFEVNYSRYDSTGDHVVEAWIRIYRGPYDGILPTIPRLGEHVFAPAIGGGELAGAVRLGPDIASFNYVGTVFAVESDGTTSPVSAALALHAGAPFHVANDILFSGTTSTSAPFGGVLARSIHGADATAIRSVTGGDLGVFGSDGTTLAWEEATGWDSASGTYASRSLWSGTYDGTIHAARVRDMTATGVSDAAVGGGYFVEDEDDAASGHHVYAIYRLSDGTRAIFDPIAAGGSAPAERVAFVAADELVFDTMGVLWRVDPRGLMFM